MSDKNPLDEGVRAHQERGRAGTIKMPSLSSSLPPSQDDTEIIRVLPAQNASVLSLAAQAAFDASVARVVAILHAQDPVNEALCSQIYANELRSRRVAGVQITESSAAAIIEAARAKAAAARAPTAKLI